MVLVEELKLECYFGLSKSRRFFADTKQNLEIGGCQPPFLK